MMNTPTHAYGLGVVGCGSVLAAYQPVIERLHYRRRLQPVVFADRNLDAARLAAQAMGAAAFTDDYQRVVEDPQVEIVVVLTSMLEHAMIARLALQAGKHVLVEKPMATDLEQAAELVELAGQGPGYLLPAPFTLLSPTFQDIAHHIQRGDIGRPLSARARYGWSGPWWSRWFYQAGGGAIFDLAPYNLTTLTGLLGPARRVAAMTGTAIPRREIIAGGEQSEWVEVQVEDNAHILVDFGDATFAVITAGFTLQQYRGPAVEIYGSQGTVQMLGDDWDPDGYELWQNSIGAWQVFKERDPNWSWCDGLNHLVDCLEQGRQPLVTPQQAYHVLEIMVRAKQSGQQGRALAVESSFTLPLFDESGEKVEVHKVHDRTHQ